MISDRQKEDDNHWLRHAIKLALQGQEQGEVPIGAVLIDHDQTIMGEGWNQPIVCHDPTAHAEIVALRQAGQQIKNYRLLETTLYTTIEPCIMCVGAIVHARVKRLVYGATDPKAGAVESICRLLDLNALNHRVVYHGGLLAHECGQLLKTFFKERR